ncbi:MAG TPA: serine/threonine-protein kinase [Myxococcaceae bacterium]|nr:serine/threonine-protein kinase [Myxococcaceae bacterium]
MLQDDITEALPAAGELPEAKPEASVQTVLPTSSVLADRFHLVRHLATGGMSEVFEAFDVALRIPVALKHLRRDLHRGLHAARLEHEVRLARRVSHPNVLRVFEFFPAQGTAPAFFTMELLEGETLGSLLARVGRLAPLDALPIAEQIAAALAGIHARCVVHRDLKTRNIFLSPEVGKGGVPRVVVGDFGVARALVADPRDAADPTEPRFGSPHYMAPEQLTSGPIDERADIYALGVILFEMVTGELPFSGETALAAAAKRLEGPAPSARSRVQTIPMAWDRAIRACLERDPRRRPQHATLVAERLKEGRARWLNTGARTSTLAPPTPPGLEP